MCHIIQSGVHVYTKASELVKQRDIDIRTTHIQQLMQSLIVFWILTESTRPVAAYAQNKVNQSKPTPYCVDIVHFILGNATTRWVLSLNTLLGFQKSIIDYFKYCIKQKTYLLVEKVLIH